jgi:hypothetical protein
MPDVRTRPSALLVFLPGIAADAPLRCGRRSFVRRLSSSPDGQLLKCLHLVTEQIQRLPSFVVELDALAWQFLIL